MPLPLGVADPVFVGVISPIAVTVIVNVPVGVSSGKLSSVGSGGLVLAAWTMITPIMAKASRPPITIALTRHPLRLVPRSGNSSVVGS